MVFLFLVTAFALAGCGGGSSGSSTTGTSTDALTVAERVSVVDADESAIGDISVGIKSLAAPLKVNFKAVSDLPAASAYNTDSVNVWVEERSAESFDTINQILCSIAQSGYVEMIDQGSYVAQINKSECSSNNDSVSSAATSSQNQSSSSSATEYEYWTVNSSRVAGQPHIVNAWMHQAAEDRQPAMLIMAHAEITEAVSSTNPIGLFTINFKMFPEENGVADITATPMSTGFLVSELDSSNNVVIKSYCNGGFGDEFSFTQMVALQKNTDGTGAGSIYINESNPFEGSKTSTFNIAYDNSYFYRLDPNGASVCFDRNNYQTSAWRYGLYYNENSSTPGERPDIQSGFPIKFTSGDNSYHGWIGYYGMWFPREVTLSTGDTVYRESFGGPGQDVQETPYTVLTSGGKLTKRTKQLITLGDIQNVPIAMNSCNESGCMEYRTKWNGTNLISDATRSQSTNFSWQELDTPVIVTVSEQDFSINFYSESLGGDGMIKTRNPVDGSTISFSNDTEVLFHSRATVFPGDTIPSTFMCFNECPDPSAINSANPYFAASLWEAGFEERFDALVGGQGGGPGVAPDALVPDTHYIAYTFDTDSMELLQEEVPVVQTDNVNRQWGVWTGPLIPNTAENIAALACDWDPSKTCTWKARENLSVFYEWETGTDNYNKLTILRDANNQAVTFDPPLMIEYTHTNGAKYFLEFNGSDMQGIPGKCVDMDTGEDTECYDAGGEKHMRWVPEFAIAAGSAATDVANRSIGYYIKPLEVEMRFTATDTAACTNSRLNPTSYTLPEATEWVNPDIGVEPTNNGVPAVIDGELQITL